MSYVVAIDPGFDETALAFFDLERWSGALHLEAAVQCLADYALVRNADTTLSFPARIVELADGVDEVLAHHAEEHGLAAAFIEQGYAGVYRERKGRQRGKTPINAESMRRMFAGFGVVVHLVAKYVAPIDIHLVAPHGLQKAQRHASLETAFRRVGRELPRNKDLRDAIWIGAAADWGLYRPSRFSNPRAGV